MHCQSCVFLSLLGGTASFNPTERFCQWRASAAFRGEHTAVVPPDESIMLSRYCGDGTIFPTLSSRTQANNAAQRGQLLLNGVQVHGATRVRSGDLLSLQNTLPPPLSLSEERRMARFFDALTAAKPERGGRLEALYEDDVLAVVFKPPGVHTTPWAGTRKNWGDPTLCDALPLLLHPPPRPASSVIGSGSVTSHSPLPAPLPAHRLDARVGGVLAVAKTKGSLAGLCELFKGRRVEKVYRAVVVGSVHLHQLATSRQALRISSEGGGSSEGSSSDVEARFGRLTCSPLGLSDAVRIDQVDGDGRLSVTEVRVLDVTPCAVHGALTTLELRPMTGRRHQLRIACALGLGAPIVGDDLYHKETDALRAARALPPLPPVRRRAGLFLQALELSLPHPITGVILRVQAPEMARFEKLRARAASGASFTDEQWDAWRARGS